MGRRAFDCQLQWIHGEVLVLGSIVEESLTRSIDTLKKRDIEGSRRLIAEDRPINERRFAMEADALALIATQQLIYHRLLGVVW